jgi:type II secretion system protein J
MRKLAATYRRRAFTLVELLIGITISVLIVGAATTTYLAAAQSWEKGRSRTTSFQCARAAFDVIERHLRSALPPDNAAHVTFEGESAVIEGTDLAADSITFCSTGGRFNPARFGSSDLSEVTFYLDISEITGETSLMMRKRRFGVADEEAFPGTEEELAPRVISFDVAYYDGLEFVDDWTAEELPAAVRVTLHLYDFDGEEDPLFFQKLIALEYPR